MSTWPACNATCAACAAASSTGSTRYAQRHPARDGGSRRSPTTPCRSAARRHVRSALARRAAVAAAKGPAQQRAPRDAHLVFPPACSRDYPRVLSRRCQWGRHVQLLVRSGSVPPCRWGKPRPALTSTPVHRAASAGLVGEPDIVATGRDTVDTQPLVEIDAAVRVIAALIGTPLCRAGRRHVEMRDGLAGQVPESRGAGVGCLRRTECLAPACSRTRTEASFRSGCRICVAS